MSKTILLIDDSELVLELLRDELEAAGYAVRCAVDLDGIAREIEPETPVDLALLDVEMPGLARGGGVAVLRERHGLRCPIYLVSGLDGHDLDHIALTSGADGGISKRNGMGAIVERVRRILGSG